MSDGMGRELAYLSSHATNRYFIPNWGMFFIKSWFCRKKKPIEHNELNVVDSIVKARKLYKELIVKAHPDKNPCNLELAKKLSQQVTENKYNYAELEKLKQIINDKL